MAFINETLVVVMVSSSNNNATKRRLSDLFRQQAQKKQNWTDCPHDAAAYIVSTIATKKTLLPMAVPSFVCI